MLVNGVRSSWETVEMNASFARSSSSSWATDSRCCSKARTWTREETRSCASPSQMASSRLCQLRGATDWSSSQPMTSSPNAIGTAARARTPSISKISAAPAAPSRGSSSMRSICSGSSCWAVSRSNEVSASGSSTNECGRGSSAFSGELLHMPCDRREPVRVDEQHVAPVHRRGQTDRLGGAVDQLRGVEVLPQRRASSWTTSGLVSALEQLDVRRAQLAHRAVEVRRGALTHGLGGLATGPLATQLTAQAAYLGDRVGGSGGGGQEIHALHPALLGRRWEEFTASSRAVSASRNSPRCSTKVPSSTRFFERPSSWDSGQG